MAPRQGSKRPALERREFLQKGALAGAAALVGSAVRRRGRRRHKGPAAAAPPSAPVLTHEAESAPPRDAQVLADNRRAGSDYMVDVIKSLGFEYICANPGSSFRGLHESIINYGGNQNARAYHLLPRRIGRRHGARLLQGRRQAAGRGRARHRRSAARLDGALQRLVRPRSRVHRHRQLQRRGDPPAGRVVPRRAGRGAMVRDFTKWDDTPWSLTHFAESAVRAYKLASRRRWRPWCSCSTASCRKSRFAEGRDPADPEADAADRRPQGDAAAVEEAARMLVGRDAGARRRPAGAHACGHAAAHRACRNTAGGGHRSGQPDELPDAASAQPDLRAAAAIGDADLVVGLEVADFWATVNALRDQLHRSTRPTTKPAPS